jgi:hypothetical protein
MKTYTTKSASHNWVSQSRVIHSSRKISGGLNRWSIQLMRRRDLYGPTEKRGLVLFVNLPRIRFEVGTR